MVQTPEFSGAQTYKIKLSSGRVLGPLDLERIKLLILKNQITGVEVAREYPQGDWKDINQIREIAELLMVHAEGKLKKKAGHQIYDPIQGIAVPQGATEILKDSNSTLPGATQVFQSSALSSLPENPEEKTQMGVLTKSETGNSLKLDDDDKTRVSMTAIADSEEKEKSETRVAAMIPEEDQSSVQPTSAQVEKFFDQSERKSISTENTVVFQRSTNSAKLPGRINFSRKKVFQGIAFVLILCSIAYDSFFAPSNKSIVLRNDPIRPKLPEYIEGKSDPKKSMQIYGDALKDYLLDTVNGYKSAANKFRAAAGYDIENVKALAMLASSYLNLIDSSNKDENYFSVISKLIDMSRAKNVDLPETVIADVEFFLVVNKAEAAQNRIVEYTKAHQNYGFEMFYYLALAFYARGDATNAAKYLGQFPDNKAFSSKIFYLRGLIAESLNDVEAATREYEKAIKFNGDHAKSRLKIASMLNRQGHLKESALHLDYLMAHIHSLAPRDAGLAYYLHCQLSELYQKWDLALRDVELAVKLDPENHDYLLELYTLRAKAGESLQAAQKQARMYYFLGEGEKLIQQGKYQDAMVPLLQARQANDESPLPLLKMGDMFTYLHDVENAKTNYKLATDRAPNNIQVWSKYIESLIQSYEWDAAKKAMDRFRNMQVSQSAIDKAAADMYQKQGRFIEAQTFYKKAMARDVIDPAVYIAYAKSLMSIRNFKDAPFFFALALRFDPLNVEATISIAKCVAETESIDRAISALQDELQRGTGARAEYLAAIAEFQIQKGAWDQAQKNVEQAMQSDPNYAYPWKLQAQIYMNRESVERGSLDKALFAYKSYSERNASDPSGYLERYKIFIKKSEFEAAKEELNRIYEIYPKYPNLHYYLGALYSMQGNHKVAAEEFKRELLNNPDNFQTIVAFGKELMENGQPQEALNQFTKVMQNDPKNTEAKHNAGWANYLLKNYTAAVSLIRAALETDKANPLLYKRLGIIYREMGDGGSSCAAVKKYIEMEPDASDKAQFAYCF